MSFLKLAFVFVVAELYVFWKHGWIIFVPHKKVTVGKVSAIEWDGPILSYTVDGQTFSVKFKRRDIEGLKEEVKAQMSREQAKNTPIGTEFKIAYDSTHPQNAKICPGPMAYIMIPALTIGGVAAALFYC